MLQNCLKSIYMHVYYALHNTLEQDFLLCIRDVLPRIVAGLSTEKVAVKRLNYCSCSVKL